MADDPLAPFSPAVPGWFASAFEGPPPAQVGGWAWIPPGRRTPIQAPSGARETLRGVETVIVDEVHAIAGTKRGAHLTLSLERLERLRPEGAPPLQRIGLSATQRPLETIARFLGGIGPGREVEIVDAGSRKALQLEVIVPLEDMARLREVLPPDPQPGGP